MSTAVDARRRPNLWSYISFGSPRRRSISLPTRSNLGPDNSGRDDGTRKNLWGNGSADAYRDATMTGGQRARFLKTGGVAFFVFLILYLVTSRSSNGVRNVADGTISPPYLSRGPD